MTPLKNRWSRWVNGKALFDQLITPGEELVTGLTEQDIRALFA